MSGVGRPLVIASGVQGGSAPTPASETLMIALLIAVIALAGLAVYAYLRRRRRSRPVSDQWHALAVMGELCPHGWQAQITLYGWGAPIPDDAPPSRVPLVELQWMLYQEESGRVAVARRVWAPTIEEALQRMIDDRRTDLALEQIELDAAGEDVWWND
jgi:hypothetical protein